jgi:PPOX class probable F420-dependent enzyme
MLIDTSTPFGARVAQRLQEEEVIWLTTVAPGGDPQPNPVWFYWDGATFLIYTQPSSVKLRNILHNPRVSLHFNSDEDGGDIVIFTGEANIDPDVPAAHLNQSYLEKYRQGIADLQMSPVSMGEQYRVALRVYPIKVRGF